jgi:hypothetical protein
MKSHVIGVIIGLSLAVIALFSINFFIAQEHTIEEEIVIDKNSNEVDLFLQNPENLSVWIKSLNENKEILQLNNNTISFKMNNEDYTLEVKSIPNNIQIRYLENQQHKATFKITVQNAKDLTLVKYQQIWDLGWNPITKLFAQKTKNRNSIEIKKDLLALKRYLENR